MAENNLEPLDLIDDRVYYEFFVTSEGRGRNAQTFYKAHLTAQDRKGNMLPLPDRVEEHYRGLEAAQAAAFYCRILFVGEAVFEVKTFIPDVFKQRGVTV